MTSAIRNLTLPARLLALAALLLALPLLAACSSQADSASSPSASSPSAGDIIGAQPSGGIELAGTSWVLQSGPFSGDVASATITLDFADGQASGNAGVNQYTGGYTASTDGSLQFDEFAVTAMAGDPDAMALEQEYLTILGQTFGYTSDGATLTLYGAADQVLVFGAAQA